MRKGLVSGLIGLALLVGQASVVSAETEPTILYDGTEAVGSISILGRTSSEGSTYVFEAKNTTDETIALQSDPYID